MKLDTLIMPLLCPDIFEYIKGREEVCKIVLSICQHHEINTGTLITLRSNPFITHGFTQTDIVYIIQKTGQHLSVRFSYSLLIQVDNNCTVEQLATLLWKFMCRVVKCN